MRSPDAEINYDRDRMVARSRDLVRNDGWATGGVTRIVDSAIGSQFRLVSKPDYRALQAYSSSFDPIWADEFGRAVEAEYRMWADDTAKWADATRQLTMTQLYWLALRHKVLDGESLAVMLWTPERVGLGAARYATTVQLLDPDRLSNPYQVMDSPQLRGGVVLDEIGAATGYHIRRAHQGEAFATVDSMVWDLFPRETAWGRPVTIHDCDLDRRGQHRGVGIFTPVLARLKMGSRADRAELAQMLLQTIYATVIQSPYDETDVLNSQEDDGELSAYQALRTQHAADNPIAIGGVRIPRLAPGEELKAITSTHPSSGYVDFQNQVLRGFAAASGLSAEQVSWDYSRTNYSSARAAMLEAWKTLIRRRDNFAVGFANPIWGCLLEEVMANGRAPLPRGAPSFIEMKTAYMRCNWIGPARGWVDPVAERQGAVLGMEAGFGTLEQECAEQGRDYEENLDQRQVEIRMMKDRGLPLPQWAAGPPNQPQGGRNDR
nr:phage portal protein [Pararoseomonas indoligenes]